MTQRKRLNSLICSPFINNHELYIPMAMHCMIVEIGTVPEEFLEKVLLSFYCLVHVFCKVTVEVFSSCVFLCLYLAPPQKKIK